MTILNFSIPDWQLTIGEWDITHLVSQFTLRRPRAEISTPYSWQGSLVLNASLNPSLLTESLDDLENPQRWAIGIHPIRVRIKGRHIATVRIKKYFYDEDNYAGQAELIDQLGLRDFETPPKDFEGLGFQVSREPVLANSVVNKLLQMAGLIGSANIPGSFEVPPNKFNESYISLAQQICGERGYWLYCDANEIVQTVAYRPRTVLFQRSRPQVKIFERQSGLEIPAEIVRVSGACEKFAVCGKTKPQISEDFATNELGKILQHRETIFPASTQGNQITRRMLVEQALGVALPDAYPGSPIVVQTENSLETSYYDQKARLVEVKTVTYKLLGAALPDIFPGNKASVKAEVITIRYSKSLPGTATIGGDDGILRSKVTTKDILFPIGSSGYTLATKERIVESWNENGVTSFALEGFTEERPKCERFEYKRLTYKRNSVETNTKIASGNGQVASASVSASKYYKLGELLLKTTEREPNQSPPAWTTKEPENQVGSVTIKGETKLYPVTFSPYYEKEFSASCSTLNSNAEAQGLANLLGNLQHQRYRSRLITMPVANEWLNDPTPFSNVNVHNGAFLMDSPALVLDQGSLTFSYIGNYLGAISAVSNEPSGVPDIPTSPIIQIQTIENIYEYIISVREDDIFSNSAPTTIVTDYEYSVYLNPTSIICQYADNTTIASSNLYLQVTVSYDYGVFLDVGFVANYYDHEVLINKPMELKCFNG